MKRYEKMLGRVSEGARQGYEKTMNVSLSAMVAKCEGRDYRQQVRLDRLLWLIYTIGTVFAMGIPVGILKHWPSFPCCIAAVVGVMILSATIVFTRRIQRRLDAATTEYAESLKILQDFEKSIWNAGGIDDGDSGLILDREIAFSRLVALVKERLTAESNVTQVRSRKGFDSGHAADMIGAGYRLLSAEQGILIARSFQSRFGWDFKESEAFAEASRV